MKHARILHGIVIGTLLLLLSGCESLTNYKAAEVYQTSSYPLFYSKTVDAKGISKSIDPTTGKVTRTAESVTIDVEISGFKSTTILKDAEVGSDK